MPVQNEVSSLPHDGRKSVPRKKKFTETTPARFVAGTFERIDAVLGPIEDRADFIRGAVETELVKRERKSGGPGVRLKEKGGENG